MKHILLTLSLAFSLSSFAQIATVQSGDEIEASKFNEIVEKSNQLTEKPLLRAKGNVQSIDAGTTERFTEWVVVHQREITVSDGKVSVSRSGYYQFSATFIIQGLAVGQSFGNFIKKDSLGNTLETFHMAGEAGQHSSSPLIYLIPGQTVEVAIHNGSASAKDSGNNNNHNHLSVYFVSE